MNKLEKDHLFLLAIELDLPELLKFCGTSKRINDLICNILNDIEEEKLDEYYIEELSFGGVDFREFKKYLPEFIRKDRSFFDDYWSDVLSELTYIVIRIGKEINILPLTSIESPKHSPMHSPVMAKLPII